MFTRAEATAVTLVTFPAAAIVLAYGGDAIGLTLHHVPILALSLAAAAAVAKNLAQDRPVEGRASWAELVAFLAVVAFVAGWLLWLAWPHLLPIGSGSDLTHHLLLIDYIDRTGRLLHDRTLVPYFAEMFDYTPGSHLLAVLAGRWTRTDGLHAVFSVIALSVALKAGIVFLIALRCLPPESQPARVPLALIAPLLLFLPSGYFLGSFIHDSFLAQVFSELFAIVAWWAVVCWDACWDRQPSASAAAIVGIAGVATFLVWPVWLGPIIITFVAVAVLRSDGPRGAHLRQLALVLVPIAAIATVHAAGRLGAASSIAGASGFALIPTPEVTSWVFPIAGVLGTLMAFKDRRARTVPLLLGAIGLQAAALVVVARASSAEAPYLALKMFYLAIYPLAVAGAIAVSRAARQSVGAWAMVALLTVMVGGVVVATPRPTPIMSATLQEAGRWARANVPPACVDYLVSDDDSAYWLHLVVLGNPRGAKRSLLAETFEPQKALVRWILPGGLPYAIAQDVDALPRDIRTNVDVLARFGPAGVIKRRGPASCP